MPLMTELLIVPSKRRTPLGYETDGALCRFETHRNPGAAKIFGFLE